MDETGKSAVAKRRMVVLTGGGDAPGMNAALRAVSRSAIKQEWEVFGIRDGFYGLVQASKSAKTILKSKSVIKLALETMGWAIREGGSTLGTIRCQDLKLSTELQEKVVKWLVRNGVNALVVIGGDGSLQGAHALSEAAKRTNNKLDAVVIPASIDNDIPRTDFSIGVDTALNVIVNCTDKLKDTSSAVNRVFLVETMGRKCGYLAVFSALASAAAQVFCPEYPINKERLGALLSRLEEEYKQDRYHAVVVVAESPDAEVSPADFINEFIKLEREHTTKGLPWDVRASVLGHLQRGGPTSAFDRMLATRMGSEAVRILASEDVHSIAKMVASKSGKLMAQDLHSVVTDLKKGKTAVGETKLKELAEFVTELARRAEEDGEEEGCIAVLTAGADAPGMNMALRGIARYGKNKYGWSTTGFVDGFERLKDKTGLRDSDKKQLGWKVVGQTGQRPQGRRAGSILGTRRCRDPLTDDEKENICRNLEGLNNLKGLVVIGGLGALLRASELRESLSDMGLPIVAVPASVDHGLPKTDTTIGFDSALNVSVESCDRIVDTSQATGRVSIVDTMGGPLGALTLMSALASGAELALIPEETDSPHDAYEKMRGVSREMKKQKPPRKHATVVLTESLFGFDLGQFRALVEAAFHPMEIRANQLGYVQRGASASFRDRVLGTLMGVKAVELIHGFHNPEQASKPVPIASLLTVKGTKIDHVDLTDAVEDWTEKTRMEKAKKLWGYDGLIKLFHEVSRF